jgi:RNA polymerase sigma factor (TIGR02999 family)
LSDVTQLLKQIRDGETGAAAQLLPLVYEELRRLASQKMNHERSEHTLQPTALVHEAYLRLVGNGNEALLWQNRRHFYAAAAEAMRRILIEAARRKAGLKYGGGRDQVGLEDVFSPSSSVSPATLLALNEAVEQLQKEDPESYELVMLRYFGGLTLEETAETLGISDRTVKRHWSFVRAWLKRAIGE